MKRQSDFLLATPAPSHTIMDMRSNKRRNIFTHALVNFSQSERNSLLLRGGDLKFSLLLIEGVNRKDHGSQICERVENSFEIVSVVSHGQ